MSLSTYAELQAGVANWLNRADLSSYIPDFIRMTENRLVHDIRIPTIEKVAFVVTDDVGHATLPSDFIEFKEVFWNGKPLSGISLTMLRSQTSSSGNPTSFAREASDVVFHPIPVMTATDRLKVIYYYKVPALSTTVTTNDLLQTVPELYLYGSLIEAAKFLDSDGSRWEMGYQQHLAATLAHARQAEFGGATPYIAAGYS